MFGRDNELCLFASAPDTKLSLDTRNTRPNHAGCVFDLADQVPIDGDEDVSRLKARVRGRGIVRHLADLHLGGSLGVRHDRHADSDGVGLAGLASPVCQGVPPPNAGGNQCDDEGGRDRVNEGETEEPARPATMLRYRLTQTAMAIGDEPLERQRDHRQNRGGEAPVKMPTRH